MDETKKKKKKKLTTVFDLPPSDYDQLVFQLNNPFIKVHEVGVTQAHVKLDVDKVSDGKVMNQKALRGAIEKMIKSAARTSVSFKEPSTEVAGRIVHGSLVLDLWILTKPSAPAQIMLVATPQSLAQATPPSQATQSTSGEDLSELVIQSTTEVDRTSAESLVIRHEGDDPSTSTSEKTFKLLVRDAHVSLGLDNLVTVMIVECSWDALSQNKLYQAAACGMKDVFQNMEKGRYKPIFLQTWGKTEWMYGVLCPYGTVSVADGLVVKSTSTQNVASNYFERELVDATTRLSKSKFKNSPKVYPDGDYVHGMLFVSRRGFLLPDLTVKGSGGLESTKLFFQSLLRIVVGDKVLSWTVDDVEAAYNVRKATLKQIRDDFLSSFVV